MPTALPPAGCAAELVRLLRLQRHPEGGHFREHFRSPGKVSTGQKTRSALTSIDFLLAAGEFIAWHRVAADEVWHLLEGGPLRLWLMPTSLDRIEVLDLAPVGANSKPRRTVPAGCWQAAEPLAAYAYCGATVAPGFEFADFSFLREASDAQAALSTLDPTLLRLR